MNDILWNQISLAEFRSLACLSEDENIILQDWADGKSVVQSALKRNISTRTVDRMRDRIRIKYDAVQIYTPLLDARTIT